MDCPNCGVYNPVDRQVRWRCHKELPKPQKPKKKPADSAMAMRRMWIIVALALVLWIVITWLLPVLWNSGGAPTP